MKFCTKKNCNNGSVFAVGGLCHKHNEIDRHPICDIDRCTNHGYFEDYDTAYCKYRLNGKIVCGYHYDNYRPIHYWNQPYWCKKCGEEYIFSHVCKN